MHTDWRSWRRRIHMCFWQLPVDTEQLHCERVSSRGWRCHAGQRSVAHLSQQFPHQLHCLRRQRTWWRRNRDRWWLRNHSCQQFHHRCHVCSQRWRDQHERWNNNDNWRKLHRRLWRREGWRSSCRRRRHSDFQWRFHREDVSCIVWWSRVRNRWRGHRFQQEYRRQLSLREWWRCSGRLGGQSYSDRHERPHQLNSPLRWSSLC
mmetsp:Transcript_42710/g.125301  ORF Transcript_42710/g.125301 Transcript_42710/m.125301 type:complete len:205 (-) Transcript_42710:4541-5155(-)